MAEQKTVGTVPAQPIAPREQIEAELKNVREQAQKFAEMVQQGSVGLNQCQGAEAAFLRMLEIIPPEESAEIAVED
jgi:hypothetical protein